MARAPIRDISRAGVIFIAGWEGFVDHPYNDAAGNATIGFGHLLHLGPVTRGDVSRQGSMSRARALELLTWDAQIASAAVRELVVPPFTSQARFDAIASFVFNVGRGAFEHSTLLRRLCTSSRAGAGDELLRWTRAGGVVLPGLVRRRGAERHLFVHGYSAVARAA